MDANSSTRRVDDSARMTLPLLKCGVDKSDQQRKGKHRCRLHLVERRLQPVHRPRRSTKCKVKRGTRRRAVDVVLEPGESGLGLVQSSLQDLQLHEVGDRMQATWSQSGGDQLCRCTFELLFGGVEPSGHEVDAAAASGAERGDELGDRRGLKGQQRPESVGRAVAGQERRPWLDHAGVSDQTRDLQERAQCLADVLHVVALTRGGCRHCLVQVGLTECQNPSADPACAAAAQRHDLEVVVAVLTADRHGEPGRVRRLRPWWPDLCFCEEKPTGQASLIA